MNLLRKTYPLRPILWIGSSLKDLREMPDSVKKEFGHSLRELQKGRAPTNIKPLKHLSEVGVFEIIVDEKSGTYRAMYTIQFKEFIAILHVFQKKSKTGITTPKQEIDLALRRLQQIKTEYQEHKRAK
jgi:phage-related protein